MDVTTTIDDVHQELRSTVMHQDDRLLRLKVEVIQSVTRRRNKGITHS